MIVKIIFREANFEKYTFLKWFILLYFSRHLSNICKLISEVAQNLAVKEFKVLHLKRTCLENKFNLTKTATKLASNEINEIKLLSFKTATVNNSTGFI